MGGVLGAVTLTATPSQGNMAKIPRRKLKRVCFWTDNVCEDSVTSLIDTATLRLA